MELAPLGAGDNVVLEGGGEALESKVQFQYTRKIESGKETNRRRLKHTKHKQNLGKGGWGPKFLRAGTKQERRVQVTTSNGHNKKQEE